MSGVLWFLCYLAAGVLVMRGLHLAYSRWQWRRFRTVPVEDDPMYCLMVGLALTIWPLTLVLVALVLSACLVVSFIVRPVKHRDGAR
jgi:hypothetical protein